MRDRWQDILFAVLVAAGLAVAILAGLVATGHFISDEGEARPAKHTAVSVARKTTQGLQRPPRPRRGRIGRSYTMWWCLTCRSSRAAATAGVSAHEGSPRGPALVERVLRTGETVTLRGRKIWLELGAAGNVDVSVDGKARPIPTGTDERRGRVVRRARRKHR
jgi:hypothetical protein